MLPDRWPVFGSIVGPPTVRDTMRAAPPVADTTAVPMTPFDPATAVAARTDVDIVDIVPSAKLIPAVTVTLTTAIIGEGTVPTADEVTAVLYGAFPYVASGGGGDGVDEVIGVSPGTVVFVRESFYIQVAFTSAFLPPVSLTTDPATLFVVPRRHAVPVAPTVTVPPVPVLLTCSLGVASNSVSLVIYIGTKFRTFDA